MDLGVAVTIDFLSIAALLEVGRSGHLLPHKLYRFSRVKEWPSRVI